MDTTPVSDLIAFATAPRWTTGVSWLLVVLSLVIAVLAYRSSAEQRSPVQIVRWAVRVIVGGMWWQQSLWKVPPDYGGLHFWTEQMAQHAAFAVHRQLVSDIVLAHFVPFAIAVYLLEVAVAISLFLGLFVRAGSLAGGLLILNLWLGLYNAPNEWPWTYVFLVLLMVIFAVERFGRSLGADALIQARPDLRARVPSFALAFT